jgi:hypothetical protein
MAAMTSVRALFLLCLLMVWSTVVFFAVIGLTHH